MPVTERSFQLYAGDGVIVEGGLLSFPVPLYRGVYQNGKAYEEGDLVTWGGHMFYCQTATTVKPEEFSRDWKLCVKHGRDGKDGKDGAPAPLPIVKVGA